MQISYGAKEWRDNYTYYDLLVSDYITGKAYLKTKTTYSYRNLDDLVDPLITQKRTEESYTYNEYGLLQSVTAICRGDTVVKEIRYASDISANPYREMAAKRRIDYPVEVIKKVNGKVVEGDLLTYVNENGYFLRENI